jgi:hypothetical protein
VSAFGGLVQFSPSSIARHTLFWNFGHFTRYYGGGSADPALKEARYG